MARTIIEARVIPWEQADNQWGVALRYNDHTHEAYLVGDQRVAEKEVTRALSYVSQKRDTGGILRRIASGTNTNRYECQ
jgi:hypothetical protein